ncbi:hypothetical protein AAHC03_05496 [Spirometra sp. Aus1]
MVQTSTRPRSNPPRYELRYERTDPRRRTVKPYAVTELASAPSSHGVRPNRRTSREKGKGWQKSKAGSHDFGSTSEVYFSERTAAIQHCKPRARSTGREMSRERARNCSQADPCNFGKASNPKRRSSVEAITKAVKSQSTSGVRHSGCSQMAGPPVQKRVFTCPPLPPVQCVTEEDAFYGWTKVANDRSLIKVQTDVREGPKAGKYVPKLRTDAVGKEFPYVDTKPFECLKRKMDMLVKTGDFHERADQSAPTTNEYLTDDTAPWPIHGDFRPAPGSPLDNSVNEIRIEFKDNDVYQGNNLPGRVFLNLKQPTRLDQVVVDLNRTMVAVDRDGTVKPGNGYGSKNAVILPVKVIDKNKPQGSQPQPTVFTAVPDRDTRKVTLPAGTNAIPFEVKVPANAIPSFAYVSPTNGASVVNNYSAEAEVKLGGKTARTDRVSMNVKGYGDTQGGLGLKDGGNEMAVAKKYIKKGSGIDYGLGQLKDGTSPKYDDLNAVILQRVRCPDAGINDERQLTPNLKPSRSSKSSSSVINNYNEDPMNTAKLPNKDFSQVFEQENAAIKSDMPSVSMPGFDCDYFLRLKGDNETYEAPFAIVDDLKQGFKPSHVSPATVAATSFRKL